MEARNKAFQQLKPICVKLSESALKLMSGNGTIKAVTENLHQLLKVLRAVSTSQKDILDKKLADYIFFPLSSVLKQLEKIPVQTKELTFECILILLQTAWARDIAPELGMQLLILYTFVLDQDATRKSEELSTVLFRSVAVVVAALGGDQLVTTQSIPHLGKAVSLILEDGVLKGQSEDVQSAAVSALDAFCRTVKDRDALGTSFLPGIMSSLAKALSGQGVKVSAKVAAAALEILTHLLPVLFNDKFVQTLPKEGDAGLSKKWLSATAPQVKMALANILRLQTHDLQVVRLALGKLCTTLLQDCSSSMADSVSMLLEANLTLATQEDNLAAELRHLLTTSTSFAETLQSSLHYWIISLPRLMDSADETKKQRRIQQITLAFRLLNEQGLDMSMINRDLSSNLRDSVAGAIRNPNKKGNAVAVFETVPSMSLEVVRSSAEVREFEDVIALQKSQVNTVQDLSALARAISANDSSLAAAQDLVSSIYDVTGDLQIASFWLTLNMVRSALASESDIDSFLTFSNDGLDVKKDLLEQLYDFSISTLSDTSLGSETDWRLQALALETIALQATQTGDDFRVELIDVLYPVLHYMGSAVPALRSHAILTLNTIAHACNYPNAGDLITGNADYLVNAIALRLNTFDISPQAPQVLLMMVKLAGPVLLPYLDDTVESIFVALEGFHGYPKLVDLLFKVLRVIVEEGAKAEKLAIEDASAEGGGGPVKKGMGRVGLSIEDVVAAIQEVQRRYEESKSREEEPSEVPQEPWGDEKGTKEEEEEDGDDEATNEEPKEQQPPAPRTYALILNISKLTQHYLTASSPELRTSLLDLLSSAFPALAKHENSFLPLIHTLWPVLLPRLDDTEPYVVAGSLRVIGLMCKYAGDFMSSRVNDAWSRIRKIYRLKTGKAGNPSQQLQRRGADYATSGGKKGADISSIVAVGKRREIAETTQTQHYVDAPSRIIWDALVDLLVEIVENISTSDMIFDEIVEMLAPVILSGSASDGAHHNGVRKTLEKRNADAVWLALFRLDMRMGKEDSGVVDRRVPVEIERWRWAALR